jgi:hypothetical protein
VFGCCEYANEVSGYMEGGNFLSNRVTVHFWRRSCSVELNYWTLLFLHRSSMLLQCAVGDRQGCSKSRRCFPRLVNYKRLKTKLIIDTPWPWTEGERLSNSVKYCAVEPARFIWYLSIDTFFFRLSREVLKESDILKILLCSPNPSKLLSLLEFCL